MLADVTVLVNPHAGRGRSRRVAGLAIAELRRLRIGVDVVVTRSAAHCADVAAGAVAAGREAVVVCGGDGAVAAVLPVLAGGSVPLGVLAGGSGNDFARALGLPVRDPVAAAGFSRSDGPPRWIWAGWTIGGSARWSRPGSTPGSTSG